MTSNQSASKVEQMLIQAVVRDGEKIIFRNVKDDNSGKIVNVTVAQYIACDLGNDTSVFQMSYIQGYCTKL